MKLNKKQISDFQKKVRVEGKRNFRIFSWRETMDPYRIFISEMMLQQTQAERVIEKYNVFIERFPSVESLACASLKSVLGIWNGLGYNRRAKYVHDAAKIIVRKYDGIVPSNAEALLELPGIGPASVSAIRAFAFNAYEPYVETNVRAVFIHHFFNDKKQVSDSEIVSAVEQTADKKRIREWYWALLDYGFTLKKNHPNPSRKSETYAKQSKFEGSERQIRGQVIRLLLTGSKNACQIKNVLSDNRVEKVLNGLVKEGLVNKKQDFYVIS